MHRHHYHSSLNRGLYSLVLVASVLSVGTLGIHALEHFSYIDSFFFTSMVATGQGPVGTLTPQTDAGKIFTSLLSFISVGVLLTTLGFLFGPFLGKLWKVGIVKFEEEVETLQHREKKKKS